MGQSRLARRLTTIVPAMRLAEALETTRMHRVTSGTWYPPTANGRTAASRILVV